MIIVLILGGTVTYYLKVAGNKAQTQPVSKTTTTPSSTPAAASSSASVSALGIDISSWQAYEDPTYHFSLKYPPDWIHSQGEYADNRSFYTVTFSPDPKTRSSNELLTNPKGIEVRIFKNPANLSSRDYVEQVYIGQDKYFSQPEMKKQIEASIKDIKIPGMDATPMVAFAGGSGSIGPQVFIAKDGSIYQLISADHGQTGEETLKTVLSTLKL